MTELLSLAQIKQDLPGDLRNQVRNLTLFNMCLEGHFPNETSCITFAQGYGLIPDEQSQIQHCKGRVCRVLNNSKWKLGYAFKCYNKKFHSKEKCLTEISPLKNTFFEGAHLTIQEILIVVLCFVSKFTIMQVAEQLGLSQSAVIDWYAFCKGVCQVIVANEFHGKVGGEGMIVEVAESRLYGQKHGVGREMKWEEKWLLDCYCRDTKECRVVCLEDKKRSSILPLLLQFIDKQSTIVTDIAMVYEGCERYGFCAHETGNPKRYVVCPTDSSVCTNNLEVALRRCKKSENCVDKYQAEIEYRHRYFHNIDMDRLPLEDRFLLFLYHIRLVYPGPGKVGMTFPLLDDDSINETSEEGGVDRLQDLCEFSDVEPPSKKKVPTRM